MIRIKKWTIKGICFQAPSILGNFADQLTNMIYIVRMKHFGTSCFIYIMDWTDPSKLLMIIETFEIKFSIIIRLTCVASFRIVYEWYIYILLISIHSRCFFSLNSQNLGKVIWTWRFWHVRPFAYRVRVTEIRAFFVKGFLVEMDN